MVHYEYEITSHAPEVLQNRDYFCSPDGECFKERPAVAENCEFRDILNERGRHGWEFVQLVITGAALNAFWKRAVP